MKDVDALMPFSWWKGMEISEQFGINMLRFAMYVTVSKNNLTPSGVRGGGSARSVDWTTWDAESSWNVWRSETQDSRPPIEIDVSARWLGDWWYEHAWLWLLSLLPSGREACGRPHRVFAYCLHWYVFTSINHVCPAGCRRVRKKTQHPHWHQVYAQVPVTRCSK